ncbi:hypothetical protein GCM10011588_05500 [Nocardia jinanensis]|uniref:Shikimate kinase n=1 Tax=Nocardia jinanensis TaxID=382504 RepID=A0A917VLP3_9NOCA|nr:hypothetical protein GCM10011588_05500 [Nocardia jinanensis]
MTEQPGPHGPLVVLIGPPGAGKTTIGRKLARELGVELYDTDVGIEEVSGRTIPEIFASGGEPEFRRIEEEVVGQALSTRSGVVSLGGGAVLSEHTRALLRDRTVVYLEISIAEGLRRTGAGTHRPLLGGADPGAKYRELMRARRPLYREVTSVRVRTDGRSPGRVVRSILGKLALESVRATPDTPDSESPGGSTGQRTSRSRARRRARARRATAQRAAATGTPAAEDAAQQKTDGTGDTGGTPAATQSVPSAENGLRTPGRSRRARARRARARRQQRDQAEQPQTGSEQHT